MGPAPQTNICRHDTDWLDQPVKLLPDNASGKGDMCELGMVKHHDHLHFLRACLTVLHTVHSINFRCIN